jgi:hypothetical protein
LIAAAVADQRSRVPQHPVRSKIAEILARQGRQTFFFDRPPRITCRSLSHATWCSLKTGCAPSRTEAPFLARGRLDQLNVKRLCTLCTLLMRAPRESLPLLLTAETCLCSPAIRLTTRFARGTEVTEGHQNLCVSMVRNGMLKAPLPFCVDP